MDTTRKNWPGITVGKLRGGIYSEKWSGKGKKNISGDQAEYPLNKYIENENSNDQSTSQIEMTKHSDKKAIKDEEKTDNDQHQETETLSVFEKIPSLKNWLPRSSTEQTKHHSILNLNQEAQLSLNLDLKKHSELSSEDLEEFSFNAKSLGPTSDVDEEKLKGKVTNKDEETTSAEDYPEEETEDKTTAIKIE